MGAVHEGPQQVRAQLYAERRALLLPSQTQSHRRNQMRRARGNRRLRRRPMFGIYPTRLVK